MTITEGLSIEQIYIVTLAWDASASVVSNVAVYQRSSAIRPKAAGGWLASRLMLITVSCAFAFVFLSERL
jgi:hypothetical protein